MALPLGRPIYPFDIRFPRIGVGVTTENGGAYTRWATNGMPKLDQYQYLLDAAFFLYPSEEAARESKDSGGTGFLVTIPYSRSPDTHHHLYAVTNWHVAVKEGCSCIRFNRHDGGLEILAFEPHEWEFIPGGDDIAIISLDDLNIPQLKIEAMEANSFCYTNQQMVGDEIGAGDDVFMVGRFVDWDGEGKNQPALRFGHISMMEAKLKQPNGSLNPSIVADMHCRSGFSGSPVFVYRTSGAIFQKPTSFMAGGGHLMRLLGVLWGQFPEEWEILDPSDNPAAPEKTIKGWAGMSLICPSSAILDALNTPHFKAQRQAAEARTFPSNSSILTGGSFAMKFTS